MDATWRKSSYSGGNGGGCIEVGARAEAGRALVRDTKDRQGPVLGFQPEDLAPIRQRGEDRHA